MSYTYATLVTTVANLTAEDEADTNFVQILPTMIDLRCGRARVKINGCG